MSYERLARALLHGRQYYGPALESLQGLPERHRCMEPVIEVSADSNGSRPLHVLEIGSWAGASTVSWATAVKSLRHAGRVVCVDPWQPYFDLRLERGFVYAAMNEVARQGDILQLFIHNIRSAGVSDIVDYRVGSSREILPQLETASFDVIYIDGSHAIDDVMCDLSNAVRLIREGGIICGDDLELQRDAIDVAEHQSALASGRDYVGSVSGGAEYHPGVTEAVARFFGRVFSWDGFWAVRRANGGWEWLEIQPGELPAHIADALREGAADVVIGPAEREKPLTVPELVGQTPSYNLVRLGDEYIAASKALGPVALGIERLGERSLEPLLLVGSSLEEVRARVQEHEALHEPQRSPELMGETSRYNLVRLGDRYIAASKALGPVALGMERLGDRTLEPMLLVGESLEEVRRQALEHEPRAESLAELVSETPGYNLVRLGDRYIAASKSLGPLGLGIERLGERDIEPALFVGSTLEEIRSRALAHEPTTGVELQNRVAETEHQARPSAPSDIDLVD
jgi:predicted O-methyltransferase YrrM